MSRATFGSVTGPRPTGLVDVPVDYGHFHDRQRVLWCDRMDSAL